MTRGIIMKMILDDDKENNDKDHNESKRLWGVGGSLMKVTDEIIVVVRMWNRVGRK